MMRHLACLCIALLCGISAAAQDGAVLIGLVRDAITKESLPGVNVIVNPFIGTVTDSAGKYRLDLPPGPVNVTFRYIGYSSIERRLELKPKEAKILNIELSSASTTLNTVVVSAGKFEQKLEEVTVSMEVLKPELIQNTNATSLDVAMEQVPGVAVIDQQANTKMMNFLFIALH
jgi:hypothetical protein